MPNNDPNTRSMQQALQQRMTQSSEEYLNRLKIQLDQAKTEPERNNVEHSIIQFLKSQHLNQRDLQVEIDKIMNKRVAHPVWDLSNSDEGPVIVRKVPEEQQRAKTTDTGWLGKTVAIYIGGRSVKARVTASYNDGTYDLVVDNDKKLTKVSESFIDFAG